MSDTGGSLEPVPNPVHQVVEGRTWHVRPTLLTPTKPLEEKGRRVRRRLRSQGIECYVGSAYAVTGQAVTATIVLDADTPGTAGDIATRLLRDASNADGIDTPIVQKVAVVPAWRRERNWTVDLHPGVGPWPPAEWPGRVEGFEPVTSRSSEPIPSPIHEVIEGKTWHVEPTLLTTAEYSTERIRRLNTGLRSRGARGKTGWADGGNGEGVTAYIVVEADTPGAAGDIGTRLLLEVSGDEGVDTPDIHRVEVTPPWRGEDDWQVG